jgi:kynureninase
MSYLNTPDFAAAMDSKDELAGFRKQFQFPLHHGREVIYFCGNSLGLQPSAVRDYIGRELDSWSKYAVEGHFKSEDPWYSYHESLNKSMLSVVGAHPGETAVMNSLTVNLHLLMVSFYRPTAKRFKILCEYKAFPSDQYAFETQVRFHGFDPDTAIVEVKPREGEHNLRTEDILDAIREHGDELALVLMGGINYYTGQLYDMERITRAGHEAGAVVGFDLAHAAGNVKLEMHDWNVDFAAWCTYKYLNSGPGGIGALFVHGKHAGNLDLPRFGGWFGNDPATRFMMAKGFIPASGAEGWQLSNHPILTMAGLKASMDLYTQARRERLLSKSRELTAYLEFILDGINSDMGGRSLEIITPRDAASRGAQLSVIAHNHGKELQKKLAENGVIADWREPNVIRLAPVPLYNSFEDIYRFGQILRSLIQN